jgi:uncharacterized Zn-binding protein involved in type VI secretion
MRHDFLARYGRRPLLPALAALTGLTAAPAMAQTTDAAGAAAAATPPCGLTGSADAFAEGRAMLRLGDVAGCPGVRYELIPGVLINGQPAVRLLPQDDCAAAGASSVRTGDGAAGTTGGGC